MKPKAAPRIRYPAHLKRVRVRPGDVFVLTVDEVMTQEVARNVRAQLADNLGTSAVIVLGKGMRLGVIGKADA